MKISTAIDDTFPRESVDFGDFSCQNRVYIENNEEMTSVDMERCHSSFYYDHFKKLQSQNLFTSFCSEVFVSCNGYAQLNSLYVVLLDTALSKNIDQVSFIIQDSGFVLLIILSSINETDLEIFEESFY